MKPMKAREGRSFKRSTSATQAGDSVVVVGKLDDSSEAPIGMNGIALITDLGEVTPQQSGVQGSWVLGSMKLDLP